MKHPRISLLLLLFLPLAGLGCPSVAPPPLPPPPDGPAVKQVSLAEVGLDSSAMDTKTKPCEDFYRFACGSWLANTKIPADQPRWSRSFNEIRKRNQQDLKQLLEALTAKPSSDPVETKLASFYGACMDEATIEKAGLSEAATLIALVEQLRLPSEIRGQTVSEQTPAQRLEDLLATLHAASIHAFFKLGAGPDDKNSTKVIAQIDERGLGLPDRDHYLSEDPKSVQLRVFYLAHLERMLQLAGVAADAAGKAAAQVMALETEIAKISKTRVQRRDPKGMYNKIDRQGLLDRGKSFDWARYLAQRQLDTVKDITVSSPLFVEKLNEVISGASNETLKHYLIWQIIHAAAPALSKAIVDENFELTKTVSGQPEQKPRWKRCVEFTDMALGELLAQAFVKKRFSADSKTAVKQMVAEISKAFGANVADLAWMNEATREQALKKLANIAYLIGYPDKWKAYDFEVSRSDHGANTLRATRFDNARKLAKIGKPVDRNEWFMTPPTVNAYYHPNFNHMVFPAGILQPPFYSPTANLAVNMGAMGMVVGHELTHGFDDSGSQFDGDGNLKSWWTPEVRNKFESRTQCIVKQYASYEVLPGVKLNGELTLGENIADAGGVKLAFQAFRAMRREAKEVVVADGYTEDQQFFLSVGQVWCSKYREAFARLRAKTDPHSHPNWRVNGALRNSPEFGEAFQCPEGSPMRPKQSCEVW